jgi:two-component system, cell cycle sensor histidine kinase and response regulator CckA
MRGTNPDLSLIAGLPPELARRWVMGSTLIAAVGYAAMAAATLLNQRSGGGHVMSNMVPAGVLCALAFLAARSGRVLLGGVIGVVTVWVQTQLSFSVTNTVPMPGLLVTPVVVVGTALLIGTRWSLLMAVVSVGIAWPLTLNSPPLRLTGATAEAHYWLTLHGVVVMAAWGLIWIALSTLQRTFREMQEQEEELRETIRVAPDGILVLDADQRVVVANPAAGLVLGLAPAACEGRRVDEVFAAADVTSLVPIASLEATPQDDRVLWSTERRSGEPLHLELAWSRMAGDRRQLLLRDVSERVRTDSARHAMELQLAHAQRLESIGLLAAGIAHDFNNILTVVGGCGELLRRGGAGVPMPALVEEILGAHARGTTLTQQLLSFARRDQAQPITLDLTTHLRNLERFLQRVAGEQVRVVVALLHDCRIEIDVAQFEQALVNLVANARDAMPDGGDCVILVQHTENAAGEQVVQLQVSDTGIGMDTTTRERAFDPFFTTKTRGRGTGLGLAVLHGMVLKGGGTVHLTSEPGRGTTVTMEFPPAPDSAHLPDDPPPDEAIDDRIPGTILLVEDDDGTRTVAMRMLESLGFSVLAAPGGSDALELARANRDSLSLLITDVMMPGMLGPQVAAAVLQIVPGLPVLFMSGYAGDALASVQDLDPDTDFLPKPFSLEALERLTTAKLRHAGR